MGYELTKFEEYFKMNESNDEYNNAIQGASKIAFSDPAFTQTFQEMWLVFIYKRSDGSIFKSKPFKSDFKGLVRQILGGFQSTGSTDETLAEELGGIFHNQNDATKYYEALKIESE
jgi:hypothetical protein